MSMVFPDIQELFLRKPHEETIWERNKQIERELHGVSGDIFKILGQNAPWKLSTGGSFGYVTVMLEQGSLRTNLQSLLAPRYMFKAVDVNQGIASDTVTTAACDQNECEVIVSPYDMHSPAALPALLHEVGHSHQEIKEREPLGAMEKASSVVRFLWNLRRKDIRRSLWLKIQHPHSGIQISYGSQVPLESFLPKQRLESELAYLAELEHDADSRCVRLMHQLSDKGFSTWEPFKNETFEDLIDLALLSYERERYLMYYTRGGPRAIDGLPPLFLPKRGMFGKNADLTQPSGAASAPAGTDFGDPALRPSGQ